MRNTAEIGRESDSLSTWNARMLCRLHVQCASRKIFLVTKLNTMTMPVTTIFDSI